MQILEESLRVAVRSVHVLAGLVGLVSGAVALVALKGARLHRRSGMAFVWSMLLMASLGALLAAWNVQRISVVAGALTFYLVTTALLTVKRPAPSSRVAVGGLLAAIVVCLAGFACALAAMSSPNGKLDGLPAAPGFMFGTVALLAAIGDLRVVRGRSLEGGPRIARHLWRMCFALFIAAASFFLGQPQVFPQAIRKAGVLPIPVLLVLLLMVFWLVRVRFEPWTRGAAARPTGSGPIGMEAPRRGRMETRA